MSHTARVAGVGMIPFAKPGASEPYDRDGAKAARAALADAGIGLRRDRSRRTPATSTATPPAASARSTRSA